ncbi:MAG TPA: hypothetical protein VM939_01960, partial [Gemmatimonadaceae bacterium]|nr:hypothetical protein [Gemmatimonadaceae bacterium]
TTGTWYNDDALILEANVTYDKKDGSRVSVPAVTIMRLSRSSDDSAEPRVHRCQMFVDLTPLFS